MKEKLIVVSVMLVGLLLILVVWSTWLSPMARCQQSYNDIPGAAARCAKFLGGSQ